MNTGENKCIRYLMKEMDPSEELEFEQLMQEDENLLIEVESLRVMDKKTAQIPLKNPPESLTKKIAYDALKLQTNRVKKSRNIHNLVKRSMAAAIVVCALSGGYFYFSDSTESIQNTPVTSDTVSPWVDRNEVLKYSSATQSTGSQTLDSEVDKSYEKLQLVRFPNSNGNTSGIHLTGTSN